jgi:Kae1-associated kinase Bud32
MRLLGEGAESRVFETEMFGKPVVVKHRHAKRYRIQHIDETLRKTRTRKEARVMRRMEEAGVRVPALLGLGKFSIYMEKVPGKLLKDARVDEAAYTKIGKMLAEMHSADVVHGDFTPANIIVGASGLCVIDFGLSDISDSVEDKAIDLLLMKRSIGKREYAKLLGSYSKGYSGSKQVITRLADIEKRGRYQIRSLA